MAQKFYSKVAEKFGATVTDSYPETDQSDAGAEFSNGVGIQVAPYCENKYIVSHYDGRIIRRLGSFRTQKDVLAFAETHIIITKDTKTKPCELCDAPAPLDDDTNFYRCNQCGWGFE